jgi:hypothetical protein
MTTFNCNYQMIMLESYSTATLGNGLTASTVHQVFCVSAGTISIVPLGGGGSFAWGATAGQSLDIVLGSCSVASGLFAGFKSPFNGNATTKVFYS